MTEASKVYRDASFALCGVCGDEHDCGFGYAPDDKSRVMWTCRACIEVAPDCYGAPPMEISAHKTEAIKTGGEKAGEYLQSIGKFDLSQLTPDEWFLFLQTFDRARAQALRDLMAAYAPPF
ncbi:MAG: hypothetical protein K2Y29_00530 [Beijerinckiaceae bacterium]|nr:hypothetical protein [Beijerinckiaceae bacterium]